MNRIALPEKVEISRKQALVLIYTKSIKSSYAGISNYRFVSANKDARRYDDSKNEELISFNEWELAKLQCVSAGWLNKNGAITPNGRNVIESNFGFIQTGYGCWKTICEKITE